MLLFIVWMIDKWTLNIDCWVIRKNECPISNGGSATSDLIRVFCGCDLRLRESAFRIGERLDTIGGSAYFY
jgi:hypothetical protein